MYPLGHLEFPVETCGQEPPGQPSVQRFGLTATKSSPSLHHDADATLPKSTFHAHSSQHFQMSFSFSRGPKLKAAA